MNAPTQIRIDADIKRQANALFSVLGIDMSTAVNIFLRQCVMRGGLPFEVGVPEYSKETIEAMAEAKKISRDDSVEGYNNVDDLIAALDRE